MRHSAILICLLALCGCSGVVMLNEPIHNNFVDGDELYATRNGAIRVEVEGDTFGMPQEDFANLVVARMRAAYFRHEIFTRETSRATDPRFKVVMMFNPDPAVSGRALCEASRPYLPVPQTTTTLLAAFCGGTEAISEVAGRVIGGVAGPQDVKFAELVAKVTNSVFPKADNKQDGDSSF